MQLLSKVMNYVTERPVAFGAGAIVSAAVAYVGYKFLFPTNAFSDRDDDSLPEELQQLAEIFHRFRLEGLYKSTEAVRLNTIFEKHATVVPDTKEKVLDQDGFNAVLKTMGVTDLSVMHQLFNLWDTDKSGTINLEEFIHAVSFFNTETREGKLDAMFRAIDFNNDGVISENEFLRYIRSMYRCKGDPNPEQKVKACDDFFREADIHYRGDIASAEFERMAENLRARTGIDLVELHQGLTEKFLETLTLRRKESLLRRQWESITASY